MTLQSLLQSLALDQATRIFFLAPLGLILLDVLLGTANALKHKSFSLIWLANFAQSGLLPYAGILVMFLATPLVSGVSYLAAAGTAKAVVGVFCMSQLASVFTNLGGLTGNQGMASALDTLINAGMARIFPFVPEVAAPSDALSQPATPVATTASEPPAAA